MSTGVGKTVCVTGASGYIASCLVKLLLLRGYTVKASVRDPSQLLFHFFWSQFIFSLFNDLSFSSFVHVFLGLESLISFFFSFYFGNIWCVMFCFLCYVCMVFLVFFLVICICACKTRKYPFFYILHFLCLDCIF